jgi:type II secretory pathway component GspD/PulD (secretin)
MIETRFISIAKADAARLPDEVRGRLAGVGEAAHGDAGAGAFMDDAQVAALIKAVSAHAATETLAAPRVLLFNGQKAYVMVGTQTAYVADLKVVRSKADPTAVSYEPDVQVANDGLVVDFQATVSADREQVTMTLNPRLTRLLRIETVPFDKVPADARGERPSVQRPVMATSEIATTVTVPNGRTVVLATNGPLPKGARGEKGPEAAAQSDQLLLMLAKPRVIVQAAVDGKARP